MLTAYMAWIFCNGAILPVCAYESIVVVISVIVIVVIVVVVPNVAISNINRICLVVSKNFLLFSILLLFDTILLIHNVNLYNLIQMQILRSSLEDDYPLLMRPILLLD